MTDGASTLGVYKPVQQQSKQPLPLDPAEEPDDCE